MFSSHLCPEVEISSHLYYAVQGEGSLCSHWLALGLVSLLEDTKWLCCGLVSWACSKWEVQQDASSRHLASFFGQQPK